MIGFFIFIALIFWAIAYINRTYVGRIVWCSKCNSWEKMKMGSGEIAGWDCPNCNWINQKTLGSCPVCDWYEKYEFRTVSHRGPFKKVERQDIDLFYGVQTEYWAYEVKIECPKHGVFTAYIPADAFENAQSR